MGSGLSAVLFTAIAAANFFHSYGGEVMQTIKQKNEKKIQGIYLTANTAGSSLRRKELVRFIKNSRLNAVVIDVKDSTGRVFFKTRVSLAEKIGSEKLLVAPDMGEFIQELKKNNIYTIARIAVFQDPFFAEKVHSVAVKDKNGGIWRDRKGLAWVDPSSPLVWKYNIDIARSAMLLGFDELNFDYIRFPTDGKIQDILYPAFDEKKEKKTEVIAQFFQYIERNFSHSPVYISVDLFGITLWRSDGVEIGQRYQDAAPYVDYISPMVYPSHYPDGFEGYQNPAEYPYEIVYKSLIKSKSFMEGKKAKMRPWLQDFDLGAEYDSKKINAQIRATDDAGAHGWTFWNASNRYTEEAFAK